MLKKLGLPAVVLGTALSLLSPAAASARDHDRDRGERHEFRERGFHRGPRFSIYYGPSYAYGPGYTNGYYDQWGYWHPYGHYDRWGRFHPY
jgi:hypothetical protein